MSATDPAHARYCVIIREYPNLPLAQRIMIAQAAAELRVRELRAMVLDFTTGRSR